jgi:hypothetical protein
MSIFLYKMSSTNLSSTYTFASKKNKMNKSKIYAIIVGVLSSNVLTTAYYMITSSPNHMGAFQRPEYNYLGLMVNHIIYVSILVLTFARWYRTSDGSVIKQGVIYGLLMAAIMYLPQAFVVRSIWLVEFNLIFVSNIVAHLMIGAIIGLLVAAILKKSLIS